ncbi:hypothetical protein GGQ85_003679 [Nitrobacter vulgaris]|nr:hypothetical protein [Nitrobacter vulgaris]
MRATITAAILVLAMASPASAASPYCIPKTDGTDRIQRTGSSCPVGYFATGHCCQNQGSCLSIRMVRQWRGLREILIPKNQPIAG